jgi:GNAT superfamily N-acetyltransferase
MDKLIEENIVFRKLNENDMGLFISLRLDFFMDYYNIEEPEKKQIENSLKNYFNEHINKNDFIGIIAEYNGIITSVAYLLITEKPAIPHFINGKTGTLINVFTYPEYRKKGIAKKLINEIIKEAKEKGVGFIELMSTEAGYYFFKNLGFNNS